MNPAPFQLPPPATKAVDVLIVAGEHSGDEHAARMVRDLRAMDSSVVFAALGGPALEAAGAQLLYDLTASSVVGLVEVLKNYSFFKQLFAATLRWIEVYRPRAICFVDYPGMNLRLAAALRERGLSVKGGGSIKALYYISPQIWAWKAGRRFSMATNLDALAVIFPFEVSCYADTPLPVESVTHPFVAPDYTAPVRYDADGPVLLLPGSRKQAVARIFPVLLKGFRLFGERPGVVLYPSDDILRVLREADPPSNVRMLPIAEANGANLPPIAASAVLTSSGTMSMHCALAAIPGAIVYRANPLTYVLGRMLVKVEYLGIANLLLNEPMYPEFIQKVATSKALAADLQMAVNDPGRRNKTVEQADRLRSLLTRREAGSAADWLLRQITAAR